MTKKNSGPTGPIVPVGKEKKPSLVAFRPLGVKPVQAKKPEPLFHLIGTKRVAFVKAARVLSEDLRLTYGDEMTITKFGRILLELRGQKNLQDMVYLEQKLLNMYHFYTKCKNDMIEEQNLFKSSFSTPSIQTEIPDKVINIFNVETRLGAAIAVPTSSFREGVNQSTPTPL
jgi:hypothetical protein